MIIKCVKTGYLEENCYVISKDDKCLIVDPGDDFYKIEELVGEKEVLAILITHYHEDHIGALEDCIKKYNVCKIDYTSSKNIDDNDNEDEKDNNSLINTILGIGVISGGVYLYKRKHK
mgnify:CR=1 FL=1